MRKSITYFLAIISIAILVNCKGKDGAPGPQGTSADKDGTLGGLFIQEGFIKGEFVGQAQGKPLTFPFEVTQVTAFEKEKLEIDEVTDSIKVSLDKIQLDASNNNSNSLSIYFKLKDLNNLSEAIIYDADYLFTRVIDNNTILTVAKSTYINPNFSNNVSAYVTGKVTNLKYDSKTGIMTGNFNIAVNYKKYDGVTNQSIKVGNTSYINNGSFSSKFYTEIYNERKGQN